MNTKRPGNGSDGCSRFLIISAFASAMFSKYDCFDSNSCQIG